MDRQEYIENILHHYQHPRNKERMDQATVQLGGGNPGCGDLITVYLNVDDQDRIERATFEGEGCTISQAGGSIVTELITGLTLDEVRDIGIDAMIDEMGEEQVKSRVRCATLALGTAQSAVEELLRERSSRPSPASPTTS
jgi:nitrogen fixation protein NifU and related proteins